MKEAEAQTISHPIRPAVLSLLCIITAASCFFKIVIFGWAAFRSNPNYSGKDINGLLNFFLGINGTLYILIWIAVTVTTLIGTGLMWRLKISGFYIYVLSACIAYVLPALSSGADMITIQRLFLTSVFIFFYGIHLKFMR